MFSIFLYFFNYFENRKILIFFLNMKVPKLLYFHHLHSCAYLRNENKKKQL